MSCAVIFAGGTGSRMHNPIPKQFIEVFGKSILLHTIEQFHRHSQIHTISVVCLQNRIDELKALTARFGLDKVKHIVPGAQTGQQSIYKGLAALQEDSSLDDIVLINDGVRPFVSQEIITRCIDCVKEYGSAIPSAPVPETIGIAEDIGIVEDTGEISEIPKRGKCYTLKAPQGFYLGEILKAHHMAMNEGKYCFTNSAELFMHYGGRLHVLTDNGVNFKITAPSDVELMKILWPSWQKGEYQSE